MRQKHKITILSRVYAYKVLNSPKVQETSSFYSEVQLRATMSPPLDCGTPFPLTQDQTRLLRLPDLDILDRSTCL